MARRQKKTTERTSVSVEVPGEQPAPQRPDDLARFVRNAMGAQVASRALLEGSDGSLAYLVHAFFEGRYAVRPDGSSFDFDPCGRPPGDCVVWANRGGGKTYLGAIATALDMVFKRGIEVRILGGSAEQSRRMHEHLRRFFSQGQLGEMLDGKSTDSRLRLTNGSRVEILAHSERSVRGVRVQKLRCDEVDLFDPALWQAAQLVTRSARPIPGPWGDDVRGVVEVLSTMHVPMGLMQEIVRDSGRVEEWLAKSSSVGSADAERQGGAPTAFSGMPSAPRVLFKWGVVDSLQTCGQEHTCERCSLYDECAGRAKIRPEGGHMPVSDVVTLKRRVSTSTWQTEMLCREPSRDGCVFPEFHRQAHVGPRDVAERDVEGGALAAGMDFGVRSPTVVLWALIDGEGAITVIDEYAQTGRTLGDHIAAIRARRWGEPAWVGIDPAGNARNDQTGVSNASAMRNAGLQVRAKRLSVNAGIQQVRAMLSPAHGPPRLKISPRCTALIEAMGRYHYPLTRPDDLSPEKDGSDHWCDALRYLVVNMEERSVGFGRIA